MEVGAGTTFGQTRGFLFSDLRGYTEFAERQGDDAAARLLDRYRTLVRGVVARKAGAEVRTEGDSFYVLFPSASSAVAAALDIVASAATESADYPDAPIRVGVGVHAGETSDLPEGPVGSAVNMAARICAQAKAGEVLVSDTVRGLTRTRQVATFVPAGSRRLKGIAEPMALYRALPVVTEGGAVITSRLGRPTNSSWMTIGTGALAIALVVLVGYALYNGMVGPGASAPPGSNGGSVATTSTRSTAPSATVPTSATASATESPSLEPTAATLTGTRILYSRQFLDSLSPFCDVFPLDAKLYVLDPDDPSGEPYRLTRLSNAHEKSPAWSKDGSTIAFIAGTGGGSGPFAAVGPDGEDVRILSEDRGIPGIAFGEPTSLSMSPDGRAFVHGAESLWRTQTDGSGRTQITGPPEDEPSTGPPAEQFLDVGYRDDGSLLILVSEFEPAQPQPWLETMNSDGSDRIRLEFALDGMDVRRFSIAPDDDRIAFEIDTETGTQIQVGSLSEGPASLTELDLALPDPSWADFSPDGSQLVLQAGQPGNYQIHVVDLATGDARQLTDDSDWSACTPLWRPVPEDLARPRPAPLPGQTIPLELGLVQPGTYRNDITDPTMDIEIPEGWYVRRNYVDGWALARLDGVPGEVDYVRAQLGVEPTCDPEEEGQTVFIGSDPSDLIDYLEGRADLDVTAPEPITLGGYSGVTMDVTGREGTACDPEFPNWSLFDIAGDSTHLGEGETMRIIALDYGGRMLTFQIFTIEDIDTYWDVYAKPLLRGLSFPEE